MGSNSNNNSQASYFYDGFWNEEVDERFIIYLSQYSRVHGHFAENDPPQRVIREPIQRINTGYGKSYTHFKCLIQFDMLRKRFVTFQYVLKHDGVFLDKDANKVYATAAVWARIFKVHPFAHAYLEKGEEIWELLGEIFGLPMEEDTDEDIILISSDEDNVAEPDDAAPEDAVNSIPPPAIDLTVHDRAESEDTYFSPMTLSAVIAMSPESSPSWQPTSVFEDVKRKLFRPESSTAGKIVSGKSRFDVKGPPLSIKDQTRNMHVASDFSPDKRGASDRESSTDSYSPFKLPKI